MGFFKIGINRDQTAPFPTIVTTPCTVNNLWGALTFIRTGSDLSHPTRVIAVTLSESINSSPLISPRTKEEIVCYYAQLN